MNKILNKKVDRAIKLIQSAGRIAKEHGQPVDVAYSGGKDSDVILELVKMSQVDFKAYYNNTTIDPKGTIKHVKEQKVNIINPKENFLQIIKKHGYPNRTKRFCCGYLKEKPLPTSDYCIMGIRKEESIRRAKRYKEPEECRIFNKIKKVRQYYPILDWTIDDVSEFIKQRNIKCADVYYDDNGVFHPERRLGCMCCPMMYYKKRIQEFLKYPNMVKLYIHGGGEWFENHKDTKTGKKFESVYDWFVFDLFFNRDYIKFYDVVNNNIFKDKFDCKTFLENYFKIKL